MKKITVRNFQPEDASVWLQMRRELWPDSPLSEHRDEINSFIQGKFPRGPCAVILAEDDSGQIQGFMELSIRPYAEGCQSYRVAYLEGWYVMPDARKKGFGRALVSAGEDWAREQSCTEFASDADPKNDVSFAAHRGVGFTDAGLVRCFKKEL